MLMGVVLTRLRRYSGTPVHDHPSTIAWNALLSGVKLWVCLPPTIDERHLLLNTDAGAYKCGTASGVVRSCAEQARTHVRPPLKHSRTLHVDNLRGHTILV